MGARPVSGFIGLDFALLAGLLRYHHWAGRFVPHWFRVHRRQLDEHCSRVELHLRDHIISVGTFLSTEEKVEFVATFRQKLAQVSMLQQA